MSQEVIDCVFDTAKRFFDQPAQTKNEINYKKSKVLHGYEPISEVRTDESKRADLNEAFNCGYEADLDPLDDGVDRSRLSLKLDHASLASADQNVEVHSKNPMEGPNAWPAMSGFKQNVAAYYGEVLMLARRIVRLFAKVLDLDEDYFDSAVVFPGAMLRLLKYPAQDPHEPDALGIGAHTDIEAFTILCQGTQPALQILNVDGQWIQAPPVPGTFVVNIGDMLARWSNDVFISTVHRVHNCTGTERYSIPFFMGPSYDTMLRPLPTCVQRDGKAKYDPILAGEYVWKRLSQSRLSDAEKQSVNETATVAAAAAA